MLEITFSIFINAKPEAVFPLVGNLPSHSEWTTDPMQFETLSPGPVQVGSRYRSVSHFKGMVVEAELEVTEFKPPNRFAFTVKDRTGRYEHQFSLKPQAEGTLLERRTLAEDSLVNRVIDFFLFPLLVIPENKKALQKLKNRVEHGVP